MERPHYRSHQSLDYGRSWPQYTMKPEFVQSAPVVSFRGPTSSSWLETHDGRGDPRSAQWCPAATATKFTSASLTPAQVEMLNSFGSGGLSEKYAYFLDRGQGRVTRLIPADMLPPLDGIPSQQMKGYGMEVLPPLETAPLNGTVGMNQRVTIQVCATSTWPAGEDYGAVSLTKQGSALLSSPLTPTAQVNKASYNLPT